MRSSRQPATLLLLNLPRRFGHAATDRQLAYLDEAEIDAMRENDPVAAAAAAAVHGGVLERAEALTLVPTLTSKLTLNPTSNPQPQPPPNP